MPDSVRHNQKFVDTMHRYHHEIDRILYAAETACDAQGNVGQNCNGCIFLKWNTCGVGIIRHGVGDVIVQHDTENP